MLLIKLAVETFCILNESSVLIKFELELNAVSEFLLK